MSPPRSGALPPELLQITVDESTRGFWEAARDGRLVVGQCGACARRRMPPTPFCPHCRSRAVTWTEVSGEGVVFSYTVLHGAPGAPDVLLIPVVVELPDSPGVRLVMSLVDVTADEVAIDRPVRIGFTDAADGWKVPVARLV